MAEVANEGSERRIFKNKWFRRWARDCGISDEQLCEVIDEANRGIVDADLGGGVIKQSIARPGQAKSKGFRSIVLFQLDKHSFFVFGFAKKDQANIPPGEKAVVFDRRSNQNLARRGRIVRGEMQ